MKIFGVVMAGGGGTRFWPLSRQDMPKQLLKLGGKDTLLNETIDRISPFINRENVYIVTNERQGSVLKESIESRCLDENILLESVARNTAACIGLAAFKILKQYGDGIMCVFPSDHHISDHCEFQNVIRKAIKAAQEGQTLVTIGIKPTFPSTGYGYINFSASDCEQVYKVNKFVEKPDINTAKAYIASGEYLWNSGMFVWKASSLVMNLRRFIPEIYGKLEELSLSFGTEHEQKMLSEIYSTLPSISVDYGIMEKAEEVVVVPGDFGWNDVGSWDSIGALYLTGTDGSITEGECIVIDSCNNIIHSNGRLVAVIGLADMIVVETNDAVLVCPKGRAQDVKKVVETLAASGKVQYL